MSPRLIDLISSEFKKFEDLALSLFPKILYKPKQLLFVLVTKKEFTFARNTSVSIAIRLVFSFITSTTKFGSRLDFLLIRL
jgi:hypothetical protein